MTSRQAGRRMQKFTTQRPRGSPRNSGARPKRKEEPMRPQELRRMAQLVACGSIFVLLVAAKLLLPGRMGEFNDKLSAALRKNMDVQAAFSAVGRAFDGSVEDAVEGVYQAVFHPEEAEPAVKASEPVKLQDSPALDALRTYRKAGVDIPSQDGEPSGETGTEPAAQEGEDAAPEGESNTPEADVSALAYVQYSEENLPDTVSMEQAVLGFSYSTPVQGTLTSEFGYREHPVEGEERFHYGVDLAADDGTDVCCFADGCVTAVGESSSYGRYCIVSHEGGYSTLYAHCSRVTASSGAAVNQGQKIAEVGSTGMATGPHLHFELQRDGKYLNPIYYVTTA